MTRELTQLSLTAKSIPQPIQPLVRCKICKKKATCCFATSGGGLVLFCDPCFETFNVFFKREIRQKEEEEEGITAACLWIGRLNDKNKAAELKKTISLWQWIIIKFCACLDRRSD